jgi:hypothetical protein
LWRLRLNSALEMCCCSEVQVCLGELKSGQRFLVRKRRD